MFRSRTATCRLLGLTTLGVLLSAHLPAGAQSAPPVDLEISVLARPTEEKAPAARKINELFLYENRL